MLLEQTHFPLNSAIATFINSLPEEHKPKAKEVFDFYDRVYDITEEKRAEHMRDLRILTRILLDLAKIFGIVDEHDRIKNLEDENMGALVMESIGRIMQKAMSAKMPVIGKRYEKEMMEEFAFLQALLPMAGKYQPCSREELQAVIGQQTTDNGQQK